MTRLPLHTSAAALALAVAMLAAAPAQAEDCLLDTNNDGVATAGTDTDGGADSQAADTRLACGIGATATGINGTALGTSSSAAS